MIVMKNILQIKLMVVQKVMMVLRFLIIMIILEEMDRDDKYSTKHVNGSKVDDDNDHHGRKSRTLSVGWSLKSAGGLVITYRAMVASTLSVRSRYLKGELKQQLTNS